MDSATYVCFESMFFTVKKFWSSFEAQFVCQNLVISHAAAAKSLQSCSALCDPIDSSLPGSTVPGILQQEYWSGLPLPSPMHESEK